MDTERHPAERLIAVERPAKKSEAIVERDGFCI
jgi:hypothetical protein